jgi:hypothetical protein
MEGVVRGATVGTGIVLSRLAEFDDMFTCEGWKLMSKGTLRLIIVVIDERELCRVEICRLHNIIPTTHKSHFISQLNG